MEIPIKNQNQIIHYHKCPICDHFEIQPWQEVKDFSISDELFWLYKCTECHFVFTQDVPDDPVIGKYYESKVYISHSDTQKGIINYLYHRIRGLMLKRKRRLIERYHTAGSLLDYGSGTGYFAHQMQEAGWNVSALEISPSAREKAVELFKIQAETPDKLEEYNQQFKVITLWHVLEHVHKLKDLKSALLKALTPEGILVIAVPNRESLDARLYTKYWGAFDVPRHLWHFSLSDIKKLFLPDFKLEKIHRMPFDAYYVSLLSEKYQQSGILGMIRAFCIASISNLNSIFAPHKSSSVIYILRKIK